MERSKKTSSICASWSALPLLLVLALSCETAATQTQGGGPNTAGDDAIGMAGNSVGGSSMGGTAGGAAAGGHAQGGTGSGASGASGHDPVGAEGGASGGASSHAGDSGLGGGGAGGVPLAPTDCPEPEALIALSLDGNTISSSGWTTGQSS